MATRFKFVHHTAKLADGRRRKRFRTACNHCRVRKRRCSHQPQCSTTLPATTSNRKPVPQFLKSVTARAYEIRNQDIDGQSSSHRVAPTNQSAVSRTTNNQCEKQTVAPMATCMAIAQAQPSPEWDTLNDSLDLDSWQSLTKSSHQVLRWKRSAASCTTSVPSPPDTSSTASLQPSVCYTPPSSIYAILPKTSCYFQDKNPVAQLLDDGTFGETAHEAFPDAIDDWLQQSASAMCTAAQGYPSSETQHQHQCLTSLSSPSSSSSSWSDCPTNISDVVSRETVMALSDTCFKTVHTMFSIFDEKEYCQSLASDSLSELSIGVQFAMSSTDLPDAQDATVDEEQFSGMNWDANTVDVFGEKSDIPWMYLGADNDIDFDFTYWHDFGLGETW